MVLNEEEKKFSLTNIIWVCILTLHCPFKGEKESEMVQAGTVPRWVMETNGSQFLEKYVVL